MTIIDQRNEGAVLALGSFFVFFFREGVTLKKEEIESSAAAIVKQSVTWSGKKNEATNS